MEGAIWYLTTATLFLFSAGPVLLMVSMCQKNYIRKRIARSTKELPEAIAALFSSCIGKPVLYLYIAYRVPFLPEYEKGTEEARPGGIAVDIGIDHHSLRRFGRNDTSLEEIRLVRAIMTHLDREMLKIPFFRRVLAGIFSCGSDIWREERDFSFQDQTSHEKLRQLMAAKNLIGIK